METKRITDNIEDAAAIICAGGLVAVPTETVYGLAGCGLNEQTVQQIYEVKGRPAVKPLSLMVPDESAMERYCEDVPDTAHTLARRFWPGPLTIVLRAKGEIPSIVLAGGKTVGLRCPRSQPRQQTPPVRKAPKRPGRCSNTSTGRSTPSLTAGPAASGVNPP